MDASHFTLLIKSAQTSVAKRLQILVFVGGISAQTLQQRFQK